MKWVPVNTPLGSAFMVHFLARRGRGLVAVNREVGTIHAAQIASAALLRIDYMRWVITLGIEGGGECEYLGGTELNTEATGLATLDHNRNASFCHGTPTSGSDGSSLSI